MWIPGRTAVPRELIGTRQLYKQEARLSQPIGTCQSAVDGKTYEKIAALGVRITKEKSYQFSVHRYRQEAEDDTPAHVVITDAIASAELLLGSSLQEIQEQRIGLVAVRYVTDVYPFWIGASGAFSQFFSERGSLAVPVSVLLEPSGAVRIRDDSYLGTLVTAHWANAFADTAGVLRSPADPEAAVIQLSV